MRDDMDSTHSVFESLKFTAWQPWATSFEQFPSQPGLYVFRHKNQFGRLKGETDILYIGSCKSTLRQRLKFYIKPGPTQFTSQRLHQFLNMEDYHNVEIAWSIHPEDSVRRIENELLDLFVQEHHELPPWNRQR